MKDRFKLLLTALSICFTQTLLRAQTITVDNENTVEYYIQNVLLGAGINASNIEFNGGPANIINEQVGSFTDSDSATGLGFGLILGSGNVDLAAQGNTGGSNNLGGPGVLGSDADLQSITPNPIYDECVVEFDFVPSGNILSFNYKFASEEYDEFVCGTVNDAFGFFLTGANPDGGSYNSQNFALVPDPNNPDQFTNTPVSINTVNNGTPGGGSTFYCDNIDPNWTSYSVFYESNTTSAYEYDAGTIVLNIVIPVVCDSTYHIKLAIGDGGDILYDSGVFLEGNSFSAIGGLDVASGITGGDQILYEGCNNAYFTFSRDDADDDYTLYFDVVGTAENGVDFEEVQDSIVLSTGVFADTLFINPIEDFMQESMETIVVEIIFPGCNGNDTLNATLELNDYDPIIVSIPDSLNICTAFGEEAELEAIATGGLGTKTFEWSTGETDSIITVTPSETTVYYVEVNDICAQSVRSNEGTVYVQCPIEGTNIFTPNNDGNNDFFIPENADQYGVVRLEVFNRWGTLVYLSENYGNDWNGTHYKTGKELADGVYYYIVTPASIKYEYDEKEKRQYQISGYVHVMH